MRYRLSIHDLLPGTSFAPSSGVCRFLYVVEGRCTIQADGGARTLDGGAGFSLGDGATVWADGRCWLCEAGTETESDPRLAGPDSPLQVVRSRVVALDDPVPPLFRVDRIDMETGARTPRHFHRGPGIRRLLHGRVTVTVGDDVLGVSPGGAWFEPGDEPVVGENVEDGASAFLRLSLLPAALRGGKSSFVPASDADAGKPRAVAQTLLHEDLLPDQP